MDSSGFMFNVDNGYLEGLCRGFKCGILKQADYLNLVQCETLEGKLYEHFPRLSTNSPSGDALARSHDTVLLSAQHVCLSVCACGCVCHWLPMRMFCVCVCACVCISLSCDLLSFFIQVFLI